MKRDMDLIRKILLRIEETNFAEIFEDSGEMSMEFEGFSEAEVMYNAKLLMDAGYIRAIDTSSMTEDSCSPEGLTWAGHEFLDAARDDTVWVKAKGEIAKVSSSVSFELLKTLLLKIAAERLGLGA